MLVVKCHSLVMFTRFSDIRARRYYFFFQSPRVKSGYLTGIHPA